MVYARVNVILLGGYSRSGKSTLLNDLPLDKFNPLSSSKVLHQTLLDVYKLIGIAPTYPPHQTKDLYVKIGEREYFKGRQLLIELAEEVIVKNFGRGAFALACVEKIDPKRINVIETFGGEEAKRLDKLIRAYHPFAQIKSINIRRTKEQPDADGRELLPNAAEIYANSFVDQTLAAFIQYAGML